MSDDTEIDELGYEDLPDDDTFVDNCSMCDGEGTIHDADFSEGDSDHQMRLMQDTMRTCPICHGMGR